MTLATGASAAARGQSVPRGLFAAVTLLFFVSGSAGLVYQVLWMRSLGLFFGSDMYGVSIILGTFMGGLALGSLFGGQLAERLQRPLLGYGLAEIGIGVCALLFPFVLELFDPVLRLSYPNVAAGRGWIHQLVRVLLAGGALLVPTTLMGATLPLVLKHFVRSGSHLGRMAATFYAVNTLGALAGTLVGGFVLLPYLGAAGATLVAAAANLVIGSVCCLLGANARLPREQRGEGVETAPAASALQDLSPAARARIARAAIVALGLSGFGSFALEVVWTRVLVTSFSATVYSFTAMLACFLFGIFVGSAWIGRRVDRHADPLWLFASLELGVAVSVGALCLLVNAVPGFFGGLLGLVSSLLGTARSAALVSSTLLASFLLLAVPTTLLGATFAVALRAYAVDAEGIGARSGRLYFSNTLGAIAGSLAGGMLLIPSLGIKGSLALLALLFAANGLYLAARSARGFEGRRLATAAASAAVLLAVSIGPALPYRIALNFNQRAGASTELVYHAEGIQNTIDIVRSKSGVTSLVIGGNVEADDGPTQRRHFVLKGHLPLLFLEEPRDVLVIGLGMGITLRSTARHPGLERIDVAELSPEILEAHEFLGAINGDVVHDPLVHITIDDGRNFLKMSDRRYDMITADPIHPKISRVGYLYTEEYYRSIREHLKPGGVVCQWMPLYQISPTRLRSAMKSFAKVFPDATFWYVKNHGLFVAGRPGGEIDYALLAKKFEDPKVREDLASIDVHSPEDFLNLLLLGPDEVRAFVEAEPDVPDNTDAHPYLEYFVPTDLFYKPIDVVGPLIEHQVDPWKLVRNAPPESVQRLQQLAAGRGERLLDELRAPVAREPGERPADLAPVRAGP